MAFLPIPLAGSSRSRGGTQESGSTNFTVGPAWSLVSVPVDVANTGHTGLRAEIYMSTTNTNLDADGASLAAGNAQTPPADPWPPQASLGTLPTATLQTAAAISWSGSDLGSGIQSYDVRWRSAKYSAGFGAWHYPNAWQQTTSTSGSLSVSAGYDYCLQVRARDRAGNISPWSSQQCVTRALDDRALTAGTGWSRKTGAGYYQGTYTVTTGQHNTLTLKGVKLDRVGVVATKCASCGAVAIYVGTTQVGQINLSASTIQKEQVIILPPFAYQTGTVSLKTLSSGKTVQIDGLITSRT
jgi:hypothetical protein